MSTPASANASTGASATGDETTTRRLFRIAPGAVGAAVLIALAFNVSSQLVRDPFPGFLLWSNGNLAQFHTPAWTGAKAGLPLNHGRVVSVDGSPFEGGRELLARAARHPVGTVFRYGVLSEGTVAEFDIPTMRLDWTGWTETFGSYLINGAFFFLIATIAIFLRPDARTGRALAMCTGSIGLVFVMAAYYLATCRWLVIPLTAESAAVLATAHFALVFPVARLSPDALKRTLSALAAALVVLVSIELVIFDTSPEIVDTLALLPNALLALLSLFMIGNLTHAFLSADRVDARLRAAVVLVGAVAAFLLPAIAILALILLDWPVSFSWVVAPLAIFPLSVLYAVVRHDLLGVERFLRLSVGYAFSTSVVVLGYAGAVSILGRLLSPEASTNPATMFLLLLVLGISFEPLHSRVQRSVDRLFFRSTVDGGPVLEESSVELASSADEQEIVRRVAARLETALSVDWAELSLGEARRSDQEAAIGEPVVFRGEKLGFLACGRKRSGAPFSPAEREVVTGIANQAALALHNARSIRELREAERALLRSERLAAIGEFAGAVTHGIRGPLAGMRAAAQIAHEEAAGSPVAETLEDVLSEADRLDERIRTLLDFSRPRFAEPRLIDVAEMIDSVCRALQVQASRQGVRIEREAPEAPVNISTDPTVFEESLLELGSNAVRVMPDGGVLRFEWGAEPSGSPVYIEVSDTGPGIPEGVRNRVFELFFTTRSDGTGIGLATVKKNTEQLGGLARLEHSDAAGTKFRLELP